jgi:hypothetical protein
MTRGREEIALAAFAKQKPSGTSFFYFLCCIFPAFLGPMDDKIGFGEIDQLGAWFICPLNYFCSRRGNQPDPPIPSSSSSSSSIFYTFLAKSLVSQTRENQLYIGSKQSVQSQTQNDIHFPTKDPIPIARLVQWR